MTTLCEHYECRCARANELAMMADNMADYIAGTRLLVLADYEPAHVRRHPWLRVAVIAVLAAIVLGVMWSAAQAADVFLMVNDLPKHRYADPGKIACDTDLQGQAIVQPSGTRLKCEPVTETKEAKR